MQSSHSDSLLIERRPISPHQYSQSSHCHSVISNADNGVTINGLNSDTLRVTGEANMEGGIVAPSLATGWRGSLLIVFYLDNLEAN